ncbi:putative quinol monooxygenase [Albibacillus kandeliae]|uniref:putative quinol monooxygenase n=1 Tax=Albibacillus kandeliae TaxID=2174228 RepID=UPI000D6997D0|nr:putative quinol monooxygenase [Albibacillus kandeliae]
MLIVTGTMQVPETEVEAMKLAANEVARATRHEEGCIEYAFWQDIDNPAKFRVYEEWRDLDCLKAHGKSAHMAVYREKLEGMGAFGRDINLFDPGPITKL